MLMSYFGHHARKSENQDDVSVPPRELNVLPGQNGYQCSAHDWCWANLQAAAH